MLLCRTTLCGRRSYRFCRCWIESISCRSFVRTFASRISTRAGIHRLMQWEIIRDVVRAVYFCSPRSAPAAIDSMSLSCKWVWPVTCVWHRWRVSGSNSDCWTSNWKKPALTRVQKPTTAPFLVPRDLYRWPLDPKTNGFPRLMVEHFCVKFGGSDFYRAMLCLRSICCHRVSVCPSVCHTPVLYQNG